MTYNDYDDIRAFHAWLESRETELVFLWLDEENHRNLFEDWAFARWQADAAINDIWKDDQERAREHALKQVWRQVEEQISKPVKKHAPEEGYHENDQNL